MKNKLIQLFLGAAIIGFTSCEKVIDLELTEADRKHVIEGNLSNLPGEPATVKISQSKSFESDNNFVGLSGATVAIKVAGTTYNLTETSTGVYQNTAVPKTLGQTYELAVQIGSNNYSAVATMPAVVVVLDGLTVQDRAAFGTVSKTIAPSYLDPVGLGNSYRLIQTANGVLVKKVFVQNDELSDGLRITRPMLNRDGKLKQGDIVKVDMQCIDASLYRYWYSLDQAATGANQSATPTNPITNIVGGALGYFSVHSVSSRTIVIP
jgi:hypothetical protein